MLFYHKIESSRVHMKTYASSKYCKVKIFTSFLVFLLIGNSWHSRTAYNAIILAASIRELFLNK